MRKNLMLLLIALASASLLAIGSTREGTLTAPADMQDTAGDDGSDLPERDEVRKSFELQPGTEVKLSHINGRVDVETTDGSTAEVHIVRTARNRADFKFDTVSVEHTDSGLVLRGANSKSNGIEVRQRVTLRLPRRSNFTLKEVNGDVTVGQFDGNVRVHSVNGRLRLAQGGGSSNVTSVNGHMIFTIDRLNGAGLSIRDAVSPVVLRVGDNLNASLDVKELNGGIIVQRPNVTVNRMSEEDYNGQIGAGGATISIIDVRGGITIAPFGGSD